MKTLLTILFFSVVMTSFAQTDEEKLINTMKEFHQALVSANKVSINQQTDKALSFGHSNGWIQTKNEVMDDLSNGKISYNSYKEDSITVSMNGNMANVRFLADVSATVRGIGVANFHLKVLEVWVKKGKRWVLFARQAIK